MGYQCLAPPAYRADLFRFCILYMKGGLYLDSDLMPLVKLEELYDPCSVATVGHDWPQGRPQKQMKILAGQPGAPIFLCTMKTARVFQSHIVTPAMPHPPTTE